MTTGCRYMFATSTLSSNRGKVRAFTLFVSKTFKPCAWRQRALQLPRLLREIMNDAAGENILFEVSLKKDPLRLLQRLSRNKIVVAAWDGSIDGDHMVYSRSQFLQSLSVRPLFFLCKRTNKNHSLYQITI